MLPEQSKDDRNEPGGDEADSFRHTSNGIRAPGVGRPAPGVRKRNHALPKEA